MPESSPQPAADSTRDRMVLAALKVFGEHGFNGASTRALASEAGVNLAAIPYHFGGKEGLYLAVADYVASRLREMLMPTIDAAICALDADSDRVKLRHQLHAVMRRFAEVIIASDEADSFAALVLREQANPTAAFDVLYDGFIRPVSSTIARLVGALTNAPPDDPDTVLRSMTLIGQFMIFRTSRAAVLRRMQRDRYDDETVSAIVDVVLRNVDACLGLDAGSEP